MARDDTRERQDDAHGDLRNTLLGIGPMIRMRCAGLGLTVAVAFSAAIESAPLAAAEVLAEPPSELIVTVYRAPSRGSGSIELAELDGFALVNETRTVRLPPGLSRLRFEGVADGIEPASAIVTGLPSGVIEKNRDARLLSPAALIASAVGKSMELLRTNRKTGKIERLTGTILSDAGGGVVFQSAQRVEALRCSGLPETFSFEPAAVLSARPTLSVLVRSEHAATFRVTLSYLARGFDWAADYSAILLPDETRIDLGAWVTLANSNGVAFPLAHTQVVAGRVNREDGEVDPIDLGGPILAQCWPRGSTSDFPMTLSFDRQFKRSVVSAPAPAMMASALKVSQEQLGDLKLYRVPERTTLASRQSKQVRLMDRSGVPVASVYGADLAAEQTLSEAPARRLLRTRNTAANRLGLALPSGQVRVFAFHDGERLLEHESGMRDTPLDQELEIDMGASSDVQVSQVKESSGIDSRHAELLPLVPGVILRSAKVEEIQRVEVSNAKAAAIQFELRLQLPAGGRVVRADHPLGAKNGRPIFRVRVPAHETARLRYQWQRESTL
jgi:hypothetical protein